MIQAADKAGRLLAVDFSMRLEPGTRRLKQRIVAGDLGRLLAATASLKVLRLMEYFQGDKDWHGTWALDGGGVMSNQGIHHIDQLVYCLGMPRRVRANTWTQTHDIECEDLGCGTWEFENGMALQFFATTSYPHKTWKFEYEIHGDKGVVWGVKGGPFSTPLERWYTGEAWEDTLPEPEPARWENLMQNLADAVRTGAPLVCDGRDGRRSQAILHAMYQSAYEAGGGWVPVEPELA
jgi:predicted dehydrogenase